MRRPCIIAGTIERLGDTGNKMPTPLAKHRIVAKNVTNGDEYSAYTSEDGHFTFELPVGSYDVTVAPKYGLVEVEGLGSMLKGQIPVYKRSCWEHNFGVRPASGVAP